MQRILSPLRSNTIGYTPFSVCRIPAFLEGIRCVELWFKRYANRSVNGTRMPNLYLLVKTPWNQLYNFSKWIDFISLLAFFTRSLRSLDCWHMYVISEKPFKQSLPSVDTHTCLYILSGERLEPVYFDFHAQRQNVCLFGLMSTVNS